MFYTPSCLTVYKVVSQNKGTHNQYLHMYIEYVDFHQAYHFQRKTPQSFYARATGLHSLVVLH